MNDEPIIHPLFFLAPDFIDIEGFVALPMVVQRSIFSHWVWALDHWAVQGRGVVSHYNYLKLCASEAAAEAADPIMSGVYFGGCEVHRNDWV